MDLYRYHGRTFAAVVTGHKNVTGLVIEADGLHSLTLPLSEMRYMAPLAYRGQPYPQRKARGHYRRIARQGCTKGARKLLRRVLQ